MSIKSNPAYTSTILFGLFVIFLFLAIQVSWRDAGPEQLRVMKTLAATSPAARIELNAYVVAHPGVPSSIQANNLIDRMRRAQVKEEMAAIAAESSIPLLGEVNGQQDSNTSADCDDCRLGE